MGKIERPYIKEPSLFYIPDNRSERRKSIEVLSKTAVISMLALFSFLFLNGCSNVERGLDLDELSEVMQKLDDSMQEAVIISPCSWPEYDQYISSSSKDYEIISEPIQEAYAAYDEVMNYVTVDIFDEASPEVQEEIQNLRSYVFLGADYAYSSLNLFYSSIKEWDIDVNDFLKHTRDILDNVYIPTFIDEYNRIAERNDLSAYQQ